MLLSPSDRSEKPQRAEHGREDFCLFDGAEAGLLRQLRQETAEVLRHMLVADGLGEE